MERLKAKKTTTFITNLFTVEESLNTPRTKVRVYIGITLSLRLSVCADSCPARNLFFGFGIGISSLAHGCINMRRCVTCTHDPDMTDL